MDRRTAPPESALSNHQLSLSLHFLLPLGSWEYRGAAEGSRPYPWSGQTAAHPPVF